ncbi:MAG: anti-sigma factor family protein [Sediminibacterium sp.]
MELNQDNYENYLLLYIDNELTASERAEVALFLASNPKQAQELKALQAVQLKPEYIEFTEKSSLYRFEEMNATLDPAFKKSLYKNSSSSAKLIDIKKIYWATGSIAAIALGIFFGIKTLSNQTDILQEQIVASIPQSTTKLPESNTNQTINTISIETKSSIVKSNIQSTLELSNKHLPINTSIASNDPALIPSDAVVVVENKENESIVASTPSSISPNVNNSIIEPEQKNEKEVFEEINTEDNDRIIHISNFEVDGDKFRGITRRIGAIFKRNKSEKNK